MGFLVFLGTALLAACRPEPGSRWIDLAAGFRPRPLEERVARWSAEDPSGRSVRLVGGGEGPRVWIETDLHRADWSPGGISGTWLPSLPAPFASLPTAPLRLTLGGEPYERRLAGEPAPERAYTLDDGHLLIRLPEGEEPPDGTLAVLAGIGADFDGVWRVATEKHAGDGIPVWSGAREELVVEVPPRSCLRLVTVFSRAMLGQSDAAATFRVLLDGDPLLESSRIDGPVPCSIELPAAGVSSARLTFEVEGSPGLGVFYDPVIAPVERGRYGERPWGKARPDIVLFVADTFRADNLAVYGGDPELAPHLNRLAARSLRFLRTRAPSAWTLPSLSSLFTSFLPGQHGATDEGLTLPRSLDTLAELLARHGYRTGAITDAAFFRVSFGLDQGFEWFTQHDPPEWDLDRTVEDALGFVDRDDGRPLFLVVHTYRTHAPYRTGPGEDPSAWDVLVAEAQAEIDRADPPLTPRQKKGRMVAIAGPWRDLYHDAVSDLDAGFGRLFAGLEERGVLRDGYLVFTSDHGEAFGEHDDIHHGGRLWDVKLRVPLLVYGHDVDPADVSWSASLIDVLPTLAELAGLPPRADWMGTSLLSLAAERPHLAFRLEKKRELAIHEGTHGILTEPDVDALRRGECLAAYDMDADPGQERNLIGADGPEWPADLCRRVADDVAEALTPRAEQAAVNADPELAKGLEEIGYGGGGDS